MVGETPLNSEQIEEIFNEGFRKVLNNLLLLRRFANCFQKITLLRVELAHWVTPNNLRLRHDFTRCGVTPAASCVYTWRHNIKKMLEHYQKVTSQYQKNVRTLSKGDVTISKNVRTLLSCVVTISKNVRSLLNCVVTISKNVRSLFNCVVTISKNVRTLLNCVVTISKNVRTLSKGEVTIVKNVRTLLKGLTYCIHCVHKYKF